MNSLEELVKAEENHGGEWKYDEWKNEFHSTEQALVLFLVGKTLEKKEIKLYFAVDEKESTTFIAKPYVFYADEISRKKIETMEIDHQTLQKIEVSFSGIK
jgi:hypothetical protein